MAETNESGARYHNRQAYIKLDLKDIDGAIQSFNKAVSLDPRNTSYRYSLIDLLEKTGRLEEALKHYSTLIEQDPINVEYYLGKAKILERMNKLNEALDLYDKSLEIRGNDTDLMFVRAKFFAEHEAYDRAISEMKHSLEINRENPEQMHFLCELYEQVEDTESAISCYTELLSFYGCDPQIHYEKARLLLKIDNISEASSIMKHIVEMRPNSVQWLTLYAEFLENNEMYATALEVRRKICEKDPFNWDYLHDLGELELHLDLYDDGKKHIDEARQMMEEKMRTLKSHMNDGK